VKSRRRLDAGERRRLDELNGEHKKKLESKCVSCFALVFRA